MIIVWSFTTLSWNVLYIIEYKLLNPSIPKLDLISDSPYCLQYIYYDVNLENLVLDQLLIT